LCLSLAIRTRLKPRSTVDVSIREIAHRSENDMAFPRGFGEVARPTSSESYFVNLQSGSYMTGSGCTAAGSGRTRRQQTSGGRCTRSARAPTTALQGRAVCSSFAQYPVHTYRLIGRFRYVASRAELWRFARNSARVWASQPDDIRNSAYWPGRRHLIRLMCSVPVNGCKWQNRWHDPGARPAGDAALGAGVTMTLGGRLTKPRGPAGGGGFCSCDYDGDQDRKDCVAENAAPRCWCHYGNGEGPNRDCGGNTRTLNGETAPGGEMNGDKAVLDTTWPSTWCGGAG